MRLVDHLDEESYLLYIPQQQVRFLSQNQLNFLAILKEENFSEVPRVLLSDQLRQWALFSWIDGEKIKEANFAQWEIYLDFIIDLQRVNFVGFENLIDKLDSTGTGGDGIKPILTSFVHETEPTDGTHSAKHLTKPVNLEESAVGLKILFAANRPADCQFRVYYRTATSDEDLSTQAFRLQPEFSNNPADDDNQTFREYEYLPGGQIGNLDAFTKFQIKIVMRSTNQSKIPTLKDLRVIAMVT